ALEDVYYLDRAYAELSTVTANQVREAANRYLAPDDTSAVIYLPEDQGVEFTSDDLQRAFSVVELRASPGLRMPLPTVPAPRAASSAVTAEVHHAALPAADLLVRRKPGVPTVTIGMYRPRRDVETAADAGLASLAVRSSVRGAGDYDAAALAFAFERLGGSLGASINSDWTGYAATVRKENAGEAAVLLSTVMGDPRFEQDDMARERALLIEEARQVRDDMLHYPLLLGFRAAFGDRGYGLPVHGLPESLAQLDTVDLRRWHEKTGRSRPVVVAVGDAEPGQLIELLAGVVEWMPAVPAGGESLPQAMELSGVVQDVKERAKAQTGMAMVFPGPGRGSPDRHAAEVLSAVASG
ncbi:MAG: insulinase family protein, partial [Gemmatimonadales bacterium]